MIHPVAFKDNSDSEYDWILGDITQIPITRTKFRILQGALND